MASSLQATNVVPVLGVAIAPPHHKRPTTSFGSKILAGGFAGIVGVSCIYPLDLIKTRLQNQRAGPTGQLAYKGGLDCMQQILKAEGVRGLYRGLVWNLIGVTPEKAIKLAGNSYFRDLLQGDRETITLGEELMAGGGAGFCQVIVTTPMERIKIQFQVNGTSPDPKLRNMTAMDHIRTMGVSGIYRGTVATLLRDVPFSMMYFTLYANLKEHFADANGTTPFHKVLGSAFIAGTIASAAATPMDVVKTRLQAPLAPGEAPYKGIRECTARIWKNEGGAAFFKGVVPRVMIISPLFGIALTVFEIQQRYIG
eukprot:Opistho-2@88160